MTHLAPREGGDKGIDKMNKQRATNIMNDRISSKSRRPAIEVDVFAGFNHPRRTVLTRAVGSEFDYCPAERRVHVTDT